MIAKSNNILKEIATIQRELGKLNPDAKGYERKALVLMKRLNAVHKELAADMQSTALAFESLLKRLEPNGRKK